MTKAQQSRTNSRRIGYRGWQHKLGDYRRLWQSNLLQASMFVRYNTLFTEPGLEGVEPAVPTLVSGIISLYGSAGTESLSKPVESCHVL